MLFKLIAMTKNLIFCLSLSRTPFREDLGAHILFIIVCIEVFEVEVVVFVKVDCTVEVDFGVVG